MFQIPNSILNDGGKGALNHARLRMGLSALNAHRKKYNFISFNDCPKCGQKPENEVHYLLKCPDLVAHRAVLMGTISPLLERRVEISLPPITHAEQTKLVSILLYGSPDLSVEDNKVLFESVRAFIEQSNRF